MPDDARLFAYLAFRDAPAGIAWLEALGFAVVTRQEVAGRVVHAELVLGEVALMVASDEVGYDVPALRGLSTGGGLYLHVDGAAEVDDLHHRAVRSGGTTVIAPEDTEWGSRRARVLDPEGHEWSFGSYRPGRSWS